MLNKKLKLNKNILKRGVEKKSIRDGFGEGLVMAGEKDEQVIALTADLRNSTRVRAFSEKFPDRFFELGVAEQAMITVAAGMANYGKIPFTTSYAVFSPGRTFEQIKVTVCLNNVAVKIVGAHAGFGAGLYGATHQSFEDIALMRTVPNMVVVSPADAIEAKKATIAIAKNEKPTYLRLARQESPIMTTDKTPFVIGRAEKMWEDKDPQVAIIATGPILHEALKAAKTLQKTKIESLVINCHTIKPIDELTLIRAAKTTGCLVTVEEHQVNGGLGSAVSEVLSKNFPAPIEFVGMQDSFSESGDSKDLLEKYNITAADIVRAAKRAIRRKNAQG